MKGCVDFVFSLSHQRRSGFRAIPYAPHTHTYTYTHKGGEVSLVKKKAF